MYAPQTNLPSATKYFLDALSTGEAKLKTPDGIDTVFAQKMQQGIAQGMPQVQGMPQAKQDYAAAAPSMMENMKRQQMQQMVREAMQPQPAGIEGLPAPNMQGMAEGGVIGFAGDGEFGSMVPNPAAMATDELRAEEFNRRRQEEYQRRIAANEAYRANIARQKQEEQQRAQLEFLDQSAPAVAARVRQQMPSAPQATPPAPPMSPEAQALMQRQVSRGGAPAPAPAPARDRVPAASQTAPTPQGGIATVLPAIKEPGGTDRERIETAGSSYMTEAERMLAEARGIEARRKQAMQSMPDLNQRGIAALEAAEQERKRLLDVDRSDDSRRRWAGVFRGWGGDRDAYDRILTGIANRDAMANQAQLNFEQSRIKEMQAQQARALGEFDRERALLKEAADLKNKARDDMLKAQQIAAQVETGELTSRTNIYDAQMRARDAELNRQAQMRLEEYRRQTQLMKPKEQDNVARLESMKLAELTGGKPENATPSQKLQALDFAIKTSRGTGVEEKAELSNLRLRATMIQNELKEMIGESPRKQQLQRDLDAIYRQLGGAPATSNLPQAAVSQLKEGVVTTFANGQQWTLKNGQPTQVK